MPDFITNLYHGTPNVPKNELSVPLFVTTEKGGAEWFAREKSDSFGSGVILEGNLTVNKVFVLDRYEQIDEILETLKIDFKRDPCFECDEIGKHSPYDGTNDNDIFFIPDVINYLKEKGFSAVKTWDVLLNDQIETYIVLEEGLFQVDKVHRARIIQDGDYGDDLVFDVVEKYKTEDNTANVSQSPKFKNR